jgi:hypothetical protein
LLTVGARRTCAHLKALRGERAELARVSGRMAAEELSR